MTPPIRLRPETGEDDAFLIHLYGTTREWELAHAHLTEQQKTALIESQFHLQRVHYRKHFSGASFDVVLWEEERVGRLYVLRQEQEIRIVDLAILPGFRGKGIGSALLAGLIEEGSASGRALSLHVETQNPARRLYERHGFRLAEEKGPFVLLERPLDKPGV